MPHFAINGGMKMEEWRMQQTTKQRSHETMKPLPFNIPKTVNESFRVQEDKLPHFYDVLHCHPEIQLTLIVRSEGVYSIAHQMGQFKRGNMYLIGSDVPPCIQEWGHLV